MPAAARSGIGLVWLWVFLRAHGEEYVTGEVRGNVSPQIPHSSQIIFTPALSIRSVILDALTGTVARLGLGLALSSLQCARFFIGLGDDL